MDQTPQQQLRGLGVALVTPFQTGSRKIDFAALERIVEFQIENGTDYLVVLGTTGETATLSDPERYALLDRVIELAEGRIPLVAGYGGNDTEHIIGALRDYPTEAFAAILSVTPYYNKPNQTGLYAHYARIAERAPDTPIVLYNVPGRTACNLEPVTVLRLADDFEHIVGIKEASGDLEQCMKLAANRPDDFLLISGDDVLTLPLLAAGFDGLISVLGNARPTEMKRLVDMGLNGDFSTARTTHYELFRTMQLIFAEGNPTGVKALMHSLGLLENVLRLPLVAASAELDAQIRALILTETA